MPLIELAALYGWLPPESRTKSAQAGDMDDRRWSDRDWMTAAQVGLLQLLVQISWVGMRIEKQPPKFAPVRTPVTRAEYEREQAQEAEFQARVQALRKYSPTANRRPDPSAAP